MSRSAPDPTGDLLLGRVAFVERQEWEEPVDGDALRFAPAPPLSARTWRHPSELGTSEALPIPPSPSLSRVVVVCTGLVGLACAVAFGLLLLPGTGPDVVQGPSTSIGPADATNLSFTTGPEPAWIGIRSARAAAGGATVTEVMVDSPAQLAGLRAGDVIVQVGETQVAEPDDLADCLRHYRPGVVVQVDLHRNGEPMHVDVELGTPPPD